MFSQTITDMTTGNLATPETATAKVATSEKVNKDKSSALMKEVRADIRSEKLGGKVFGDLSNSVAVVKTYGFGGTKPSQQTKGNLIVAESCKNKKLDEYRNRVAGLDAQIKKAIEAGDTATAESLKQQKATLAKSKPLSFVPNPNKTEAEKEAIIEKLKNKYGTKGEDGKLQPGLPAGWSDKYDVANSEEEASAKWRELEAVPAIVGYQIKNVGEKALRILTQECTKNAEGKYDATYVVVTLAPNAVMDITVENFVLNFSNYRFNGLLANGRINYASLTESSQTKANAFNRRQTKSGKSEDEASANNKYLTEDGKAINMDKKAVASSLSEACASNSTLKVLLDGSHFTFNNGSGSIHDSSVKVMIHDEARVASGQDKVKYTRPETGKVVTVTNYYLAPGYEKVFGLLENGVVTGAPARKTKDNVDGQSAFWASVITQAQNSNRA